MDPRPHGNNCSYPSILSAATGAGTALVRGTRGTEAGELHRAPRSAATILMMYVNALTDRGIRAVRQRERGRHLA